MRLSRIIFNIEVVSDNNISELPLATLSLTGLVPQSTNTENHKVALPLNTLPLTGGVPNVITSDHNSSELPLASLSLTGLVPQATVSDTADNISELPLNTLVLTGLVPDVKATEYGLYAQYKRSLNPIAWWRLGESAGTYAEEENGNYHGTYVNDPALGVTGLLADGDNDTAVTFSNVSNEYIGGMGDVLGFASDDAFSFDVPLTIDIATASTIVSKWDGTGGYLLLVSSYKLYLYLRVTNLSNEIRVHTTDALSSADTHNATVTYDGSSNASGVTIYVDGKSVDLTVDYDTLTGDISNSGNFEISRFNGGDEWTGTLDEPAIFDYELTVEQAKNLAYLALHQNIIDIPLATLSLIGLVPQATVSEPESNISELPLATFDITGLVPSFTYTEHNISEFSVGLIDIVGFAPTVTVTTGNNSELPLGTVDIIGFAPQAITTEHNKSELPLGTLPLIGLIPQVTVSSIGTNISDLPVATIDLTGYPIGTTTTGPIVVSIEIQRLSLEQSRYPLSSADGKDIPLDVLGPIKYLRQAITDTPLVFVVAVTGYIDTLIEIISPIDVIISFADTVPELSTDANDYMLQADDKRVLLPTNEYFTMVAANSGESGDVDINFLRKWNTLAIKDEI